MEKEIITWRDVSWFMAYYKYLLWHDKNPWVITGIATRDLLDGSLEIADLGIQPSWEEVDKHIALVGVDVQPN